MIKDFVIIDELEVDFENGFNVITGETGAGKSLIIGAILQVTGARMAQNLIKNGKDKSIIQAHFILNTSSLKGEYGLDDDGKGEIILSRELHRSGKSIAKINGMMVSNQILRSVSSELITVFGQNDKLKLFDEREQLKILDSFLLHKNKPLFDELESIADKYIGLKKKKEKLEFIDNSAIERERELLKYQINDIDDANLLDEDNYVEEKYQKAKNSKEIIEALSLASYSIDNDDEYSISRFINTSVSSIDSIVEYDEEYSKISEKLEDIKYNLIDIKSFLDREIENSSSEIAHLYELEKRLDTINLLKKKYGNSIEEIYEYRNELDKKLLELDSIEGESDRIDGELSAIKVEYMKKAEKLSKLRQDKAIEISKNITKALLELNFKSAEFKIDFQTKDKVDRTGIDEISFMVKINAGSEFDKLKTVASGGELSRVMLAIQEEIAKEYNIPILIFDEIDTGISGKAANALAKKLFKVSLSHQLIVVTHLLQVALYGEEHYLIEKCDENGITNTYLKKLDMEGRVSEVYRLISSEGEFEELKNEAKKLIENVDRIKNDIRISAY